MEYICSSFKDAKEYGSILDIKNINFNSLFDLILNFESNKNNLNSFKYQNEIQTFKNSLNQAIILSQNYDVVITNPPYMGTSGMNANLKDYLKKNFPNSKSDLFAVFIEKCHDFSKSKGFVAMITQQSFMFLSTFESLRVNLINNHTIIDMAHLGAHAFEEIGGEVVQATSFINKNNFIENYNSAFHRLIEFNSESKKEQEFHNDKNKYFIKQDNFDKIPGSPIAYWIDNNLISCFNNTKLESLANIKVGLQTGENDRFLRYWFEVDFNKIGFSSKTCEESELTNKKWFPYNKGGSFRKWYGNQEYIINWEKNGDELRNFKKSVLRNSQFYFNESLSWSKISSGKIAFRYYPNGFIFDVAGCSIFLKENLNYIAGFLNSDICSNILDLISPTLNYEVGHISSLPIIINESKKDEIENIVLNNISLCENDWNDYETSWNFKKHPILYFNNPLFENNIISLGEYKKKQFIELKQSEMKLNEIFSEIYKIPHTNSIENKHVSINQPNSEDIVKSFISYSVGCMFGRYSLDQEGLQFAGGNFDINNYHKFIPDDDNIIPVLDTEYFEDDIVGRFVEFVKTCFGQRHLEENLEFIGSTISNSNKPPREKIRDYFLKEFFNNHNKIYKKRPIYWQFSSGKENAFNCLIYTHRFNSGIIAKLRTEYLHKTQKAIEQRIYNCENILKSTESNLEKTKVMKEKNKLIKQLEESIEFDEALNYVSNLNINLDWDDGIKFNHEKFQNILISKDGVKDKKINLLKKI